MQIMKYNSTGKIGASEQPTLSGSSRSGKKWKTYAVAAVGAVISVGPIAFAKEQTAQNESKNSADSTKPSMAEESNKPAEISPEAQALLDQISAAYGDVDALELTGSISTNIDVDGMQENSTTKFDSSFQAPNRFRHSAEDSLIVGSTGEKVFVYNPATKEYLMSEAPADSGVTGLPPMIPEILQSQNPSLLFAVLGDPTSDFSRLFGKIEKAEDTTIDGLTHPTLKLAATEGEGDFTLVFNPKTHLLKQFRVDMKPILVARGASEVKAAEIVIDYSAVKSEVTFGDDSFAWVPPEGARDVREARQSGQGDGSPGLVGQPAPDFQLNSVEGRTVSLADLNGKIVVLDFWASWCPPCIKSLPHMGDLYLQKRDEGVEIFAVNMAESVDTVEAFLKSKELNIPVLLDKDGSVANQYNVASIPQTVVIGKDGIVKNVFKGFGDDTISSVREAIESAN